jgi:hypothetical protein
MFNNFWKLIRQDSYVEFLERELDTVRKEKLDLQTTLHHVLRIHLIPQNLDELKTQPTVQPIPISRSRSMRSALSELQKQSFDKETRKQIEETEKVISELEPTGSDELKEY